MTTSQLTSWHVPWRRLLLLLLCLLCHIASSRAAPRAVVYRFVHFSASSLRYILNEKPLAGFTIPPACSLLSSSRKSEQIFVLPPLSRLTCTHSLSGALCQCVSNQRSWPRAFGVFWSVSQPERTAAAGWKQNLAW